ncbi:MAG TPA: DUF4886 domain-containing protein, partial [Roseimicrobium sp.]|nr:DUF4886 domain-containing protein [Roseimicrobium sp.]
GRPRKPTLNSLLEPFFPSGRTWFEWIPHPTRLRMIKHSLRLIAAFFVLALAVHAEVTPQSPDEIKLLTIGNSFAVNSTAYLENFAQTAGQKLRFYGANLGAHSMQMHVGYLRAYEADPTDPKGRPYQGIADPKTGAKPKLSLRQALELKRWDYVTIQQLSALSFQPDSYEPYAGELIAYIRKYAPQAKILGLQTWAYREDSWLFQKTTTQERMHLGIKKAYAQLAERYGIQIIPVGDAFQAARATPRWHFQYPDPKFDRANAKPGELPEQPGSLNVGWKWEKDAKTGKPTLVCDSAHCNAAGQYLATAVLYEVLFPQVGGPVYCPPKLAVEDAVSLRKIAHDTVAQSIVGNIPGKP